MAKVIITSQYLQDVGGDIGNDLSDPGSYSIALGMGAGPFDLYSGLAALSEAAYPGYARQVVSANTINFSPSDYTAWLNAFTASFMGPSAGPPVTIQSAALLYLEAEYGTLAVAALWVLDESVVLTDPSSSLPLALSLGFFQPSGRPEAVSFSVAGQSDVSQTPDFSAFNNLTITARDAYSITDINYVGTLNLLLAGSTRGTASISATPTIQTSPVTVNLAAGVGMVTVYYGDVILGGNDSILVTITDSYIDGSYSINLSS